MCGQITWAGGRVARTSLQTSNRMILVCPLMGENRVAWKSGIYFCGSIANWYILFEFCWQYGSGKLSFVFELQYCCFFRLVLSGWTISYQLAPGSDDTTLQEYQVCLTYPYPLNLVNDDRWHLLRPRRRRTDSRVRCFCRPDVGFSWVDHLKYFTYFWKIFIQYCWRFPETDIRVPRLATRYDGPCDATLFGPIWTFISIFACILCNTGVLIKEILTV